MRLEFNRQWVCMLWQQYAITHNDDVHYCEKVALFTTTEVCGQSLKEDFHQTANHLAFNRECFY